MTTKTDLNATAHRSGDVRATIIIPLAQNIIGGAALTVLIYLALLIVGSLDESSGAVAIAAGLGMASLATIIRFFADDFGLLHIAYQRGWADCEAEMSDQMQDLVTQIQAGAEAHQSELEVLHQRLENAVRPIVVNTATRATYVTSEGADPAFEDAKRLLYMMKPTERNVPGRNRSELSQLRQESALSTLARAGVLMRKGNNYELTCDPLQALVNLEAMVD